MIGRRPTLDDRTTGLGLAAALALVVLVRVWVPYDLVFRDGAVVLAGNDPYFYRYWVDHLLASDASPLRPGSLATLPDALRTHDVLFIVSMWVAALALGGDAHAAGLVLAWYPVVAAVVTAILVYLLARLLTGDRRVALLAVGILALTPAHAYRTMLGFGDHHAFDYVWLALAAAALVALAVDDADRPWAEVGYWIAAGALGVAVAAQSLSWRGGPLLLVPIAAYAVGIAVSCVRAGRSPVVENAGLLVGLALAAVLAAGVHLGLNWAPLYRSVAPALLFALVLGVVVAGDLTYRAELPWPVAALGVSLVVGAWSGAIWSGPAALTAPMAHVINRRKGIGTAGPWDPGEAVSLLGSAQTPVLLFGLLLVVALPVMGLAVVALLRAHRPAWLAVSVYAWWFLALSINRIRFTGQLAIFVAVFAAIGLLYLAARMEAVRPLAVFDDRRWKPGNWPPPAPRDLIRSIGIVCLLFVLVIGMGVAQMPGTMERITVDEPTYETATWMADYSADKGWTYPHNYVFSEWGTNRFYNYVVSGESESYGHAKGNYREFATSFDGDGWYEKLSERTGFIVMQPTRYAYPADSMQVRLGERYGSRGDDVAGLAHYRLVYVSDDGTRVFTLVEGATIVGTAAPNTTVHVETEVTVGETHFTYERAVQTDSDGRYSVTVPYPGRYTIEATETEDEVVVTEHHVANGTPAAVNSTSEDAH